MAYTSTNPKSKYYKPSKNVKPSYKGYTPSQYNEALSNWKAGKSPQIITVTSPTKSNKNNAVTPSVSVQKISNSNIGLGISPAISVESILSNISNSRNTRTKLTPGSLYGKFDNWLGGYLPGGVTPTQAKTNKLTTKTEQINALINATNAFNIQQNNLDSVRYNDKLKDDGLKRQFEEAMAEQERASKLREIESQARYDEQKDQWQTAWYEQLGLWNSAQEQALQKQLSTQTLGQLLPSVNPTITTSEGTQPFIFEETKEDSFLDKAKNYGIVALIAVAGILLLPQLLKK